MSEQRSKKGKGQSQKGQSQKGQSQKGQGQKGQGQKGQGQKGQGQKGQGQKSQSQKDNSLQSGRGNTIIQAGVVSKVASDAAQEIEGVRMGDGASQAASSLLGSVTGGSGESRTQGVSVEVGEVEAAVDLTMTVEHGKPVPQISEAVRRNVVDRIENLVGLRATEVNITVADVFFLQEEQEQSQQPEENQGRE